jgi:hypothetical protein
MIERRELVRAGGGYVGELPGETAKAESDENAGGGFRTKGDGEIGTCEAKLEARCSGSGLVEEGGTRRRKRCFALYLVRGIW